MASELTWRAFFFFFFWRSFFWIIFQESLEESRQNGVWSALIWKNAPSMKWHAVLLFFFGAHFLWSFFRASSGKFGQKSSAPPKFACSYTYACHRHNSLILCWGANCEENRLLSKLLHQLIEWQRCTSCIDFRWEFKDDLTKQDFK